MGAAASAIDEVFPPTEDGTNAKEQCLKLREMIIKDDPTAPAPMEGVKHLKDSLADDLKDLDDEGCDFISARKSLLGYARSYLRLKEIAANIPDSVEALASKYPDEVNLASCVDDDHKVPGWLGLVGFDLIHSIPPCVFSATGVTKLYLKKNQLASLPAEIGLLVNLEVLDVSENQIERLPEEFFNCTKLETFNIAENAFVELSPSVKNLTSLETFIVYKNLLTKLPAEIGQCTALQELNLFNNKLTKVPPEMGNLENVVDLNFGGNKLKTLPSTKKWTKLERLAVSWNNLVMLRDFGGMVSLTMLQLNKNALEALPDDCFAGCSNLETLDISMNRIASLPSSISECSALSSVNCSSNSLTVLPNLSKCTAMTIFNVGSNSIKDLSSIGIESMSQLKTLFVNNNELSELPASFSELKLMSRCNISNNAALAKDSPVCKQLQETCKQQNGRFIE